MSRFLLAPVDLVTGDPTCLCWATLSDTPVNIRGSEDICCLMKGLDDDDDDDEALHYAVIDCFMLLCTGLL